MSRLIDLTSKRFGRLVVLGDTGKRTSGKAKAVIWTCECDCGNRVEVIGNSLKRGHTKSCGCVLKEFTSAQYKRLEGQKFGRIKVLKKTEKRKRGYVVWLCKCDCGKYVHRTVKELQSKESIGCGCGRTGVTCTRYNHNMTHYERVKGRYLRGELTLKKWRSSVYERDGYTCRVCGGSESGTLNAHHLDGWNWCIEKRFKVSNGVTLCQTCHAGFHKEYGGGGNTREQFEAYVKRWNLNLEQ